MEYAEAGEARIPKIGLGTWQVKGETCQQAVETALEGGYRHVDTAQVYDNERAVGRALERADVDREAVFLTTKVWRSNLRYEEVLASVRESLSNLGVASVDLLLIHWPHPRVPVEETLEAIGELHDAGEVDHVGVSNFTRDQLAAARRHSPVPIAVDQVLYHPYKDQSALRQYCADHDIALTAYSPLARGAVVGDERLERIGQRYDRSAAQVALRWLVQQEPVVAIPKSSTPAHIASNLDVFDFSLTDEEMARIDGLKGSLGTRLRNRLPAVVRRFPL